MKLGIIVFLIFISFGCRNPEPKKANPTDDKNNKTKEVNKIPDTLLEGIDCIYIDKDSDLGYIDIRPFEIYGKLSLRNYYNNLIKNQQKGIYSFPLNWNDSNARFPIYRTYHINGINYKIWLDITDKESNTVVYINNHKKISCYLGESYGHDYFVDEVRIFTEEKRLEIIGSFEGKRIDITDPYDKLLDPTLIDDDFLYRSYKNMP